MVLLNDFALTCLIPYIIVDLKTLQLVFDTYKILLSGTMGVCLTPCSLPGGGPLFQLGANEIELGMGELC